MRGRGMVGQICDQEGHMEIDCPWIVVMVVGVLRAGLRHVLGRTPLAVIQVVTAGGRCPFLGLCITIASYT
ncbi:hypothetical protein BVC80_7939g10 [Macleaya cordata]|uniref:Uncharacterized protein n=1 Tax=Macleaya cordata TaxID=56857 RepID=A0A200PYP7_MACCD|nr:hypothetical protein BVC80_7939g10 [Macleaya cordata]